MENSHLNTAHMYGRRAENYVRSRRYDEATECHRKAVFHFEEALKIHGSPLVQESLQLQHKYHLKQIDRLRVKKQQYERYLKAMDYQRRKNPQWLMQQNEKMDKYNELQVAIYHNLDDTDGLLETLSKSLTSTGGDGGTAPKVAGELIGLNHSLHILIQRMAQNIDEYATENEMLREKLRCYEKEKDSVTQGKVEGPASALGKDRDVPKRDTDSARDDNLAALAPLEMPVFDLSEFEAH
ncbi:nuclear receptor-binding factor 2 [Anopheles bellator]|uniref:nuclear receptor-binding factor 2 n=1 Tax=Anopheles bellator TaxID=139047 RepID=UPI002647C6D0|nr:nuclear receptor-binding factor 2 [Anopheles bellator]